MGEFVGWRWLAESPPAEHRLSGRASSLPGGAAAGTVSRRTRTLSVALLSPPLVSGVCLVLLDFSPWVLWNRAVQYSAPDSLSIPVHAQKG